VFELPVRKRARWWAAQPLSYEPEIAPGNRRVGAGAAANHYEFCDRSSQQECRIFAPSDRVSLFPGIAFTRGRGRIGRGAGCFVAFSGLIAPRAQSRSGFAFSFQIVESLPSTGTTCRLDLVERCWRGPRFGSHFVVLVLAAIIGIVVADIFLRSAAAILFIAILGALQGLRWSYGPLVFALGRRDHFFALHSARITITPADALC